MVDIDMRKCHSCEAKDPYKLKETEFLIYEGGDKSYCFCEYLECVFCSAKAVWNVETPKITELWGDYIDHFFPDPDVERYEKWAQRYHRVVGIAQENLDLGG